MLRTRATTSIIETGQNSIFSYRETEDIGIIYCHGGGVLGHHAITSEDIRKFCKRLAKETGAMVVACDVGGANTYGNTTSQVAAVGIRNYGLANLGWKKVFLFGVSMGGTVVANTARAGPQFFDGCATFVGAFDLQFIRDGNVGGLRATIDTAWGVVYPAALPAGANPKDNKTSFGIPHLMYYADNDIFTPKEAYEGWSDAEVYNQGGIGHSTAFLTTLNFEPIYRLLRAA